MKCKRCKRELKSEKSIKDGYGSSCKRKHKEERLKGYFNPSNIILDKLKEVTEDFKVMECDICDNIAETSLMETKEGTKIRVCEDCKKKHGKKR